MEPTLSIIEYLWDSRNTWFKHDNPNGCDCTFHEMAYQFLDDISVDVYMAIIDNTLKPLVLTKDEWDELIGPVAQADALQSVVDYHMEAAAQIIALQATADRKGNE